MLKKQNHAGQSSWTLAHGWNPFKIFARFWEGEYEAWLGNSEGRAGSLILKNFGVIPFFHWCIYQFYISNDNENRLWTVTVDFQKFPNNFEVLFCTEHMHHWSSHLAPSLEATRRQMSHKRTPSSVWCETRVIFSVISSTHAFHLTWSAFPLLWYDFLILSLAYHILKKAVTGQIIKGRGPLIFCLYSLFFFFF